MKNGYYYVFSLNNQSYLRAMNKQQQMIQNYGVAMKHVKITLILSYHAYFAKRLDRRVAAS